MDLQIRNNYIKKFLAGFSHLNELKVVKYLAILGIHYLEACKNSNISFSELKKLAKSISKSSGKEEKQINKELHIIKNELAKLNQKFEEKLKEMPDSPKTEQKNQTQYNLRSASVPKNLTQRTITKKPPSSWRRGPAGKYHDAEKESHSHTRRASSIGPVINNHDIHQKTSKVSYEITPKPTEITFPQVDVRDNRNYVTRHHLDDTEAKSVLGGDGAANNSSLKERSQEKNSSELAGRYRSYSQNQVEDELHKQRHKGGFSARKFSDSDDRLNQRQGKGLLSQRQKEHSKSPKSKVIKEGTFGVFPKEIKTFGKEIDENKPAKAPKLKRVRESTKKGSKVASTQGSTNTKKVWQKIMREKAKNVGKSSGRNTGRNSRPQLNQTHFDRASASEYSHVASKIRDEVKYHKELSRQYKKMKNHIQEYADQVSEKFSNASSDKDSKKDKFAFVGNEDPQTNTTNRNTSQYYTGQPNSSRLLESVYSPQQSHYYKQSQSQYSNRSPNGSMSLARSRRLDIPTRDDLDESKNLTEKNFGGGMLDIANSFLNSPFMQHLSNFGGKSSRMSPTSSTNPVNGQNNNYPDIGSSGIKLPRGTRKSRGYDLESNSRIHDGNQDYSKHSEWTEAYRNEKVGRDNNSILKESGNRRYGPDLKEPGSAYYNKNDTNSLASSNFSNFLNDEMKGFFQKETWELKKPKHSKSVVRSSANSSHISFNANEVGTNNREVNSSYLKKNNYITPPQGFSRKYDSKSYIGESEDTSNVFKQERMSVTQLLNTS